MECKTKTKKQAAEPTTNSGMQHRKQNTKQPIENNTVECNTKHNKTPNITAQNSVEHEQHTSEQQTTKQWNATQNTQNGKPFQQQQQWNATHKTTTRKSETKQNIEMQHRTHNTQKQKHQTV